MKKTLIAISFSSIALVACSKSNQSAPESVAEAPVSEVVVTTETIEISQAAPTGDNAQTSLDWNGQYKATLPCADCEGIETALTLNPDNTYVLSETYLGTKGGNKPEVAKGKFAFNNQGSIITLDQTGLERQYFIGENQLFALDADGNKITGPMANLYIFKKVN